MITTLDAVALITRLQPHFPFWARTLTDQSRADLAEDWAAILGDLDAQVVKAAIAKLLSTKREFPPGIGEINETARAMLDTAKNGETMDAGEAWSRVCRAVTGFANGAAWDAALKAALPEEAVKAAEDFGLMRIRMRLEENAGTDFAQFRGMYETYARRRREQSALPPVIREQMAQLAEAWSTKRALPAKTEAANV